MKEHSLSRKKKEKAVAWEEIKNSLSLEWNKIMTSASHDLIKNFIVTLILENHFLNLSSKTNRGFISIQNFLPTLLFIINN